MVQGNCERVRIILTGPAGSGKDYLKRVLTGYGLRCQVMYTTRPPRMNEKDGVDYHFIDVDTYLSMREGDEWEIDQEFNGWYYGNSKKDFLTSDIILLTPSGIRELSREIRDSSVIVYLDVHEQVRHQRLSERNDADNVSRRLSTDRVDFLNFTDYDIRLTDSDTINHIFCNLIHIIRK